MSQLGNLFTILSLFCGFLSIVASLSGFFISAAYAIIVSFLLDGLDGQIARRSNSSSEFGRELDSLVDVVCFGVAPIILGQLFTGMHYLSGLPVFFFYLACSVIRLAKYNISAKDGVRNYFTGLPTTLSAGILASFILVSKTEGLFVMFTVLLSALMVSKIKYPNLDGVRGFLGKKTKIVSLILLCLFILALAYLREGLFIFIIFLIYLIFSPFMVKRLK